MAQQLWPGQDAVGKRIRLGGIGPDEPWMTVVGVVGRVKQDALEPTRASRCTSRTRSSHARDERRAPNGRAIRRADGGSRGEIRAHRSGSADLQRADDGGARGRVAGAAPVLDAAADAVRGAGAGAGDDRHLRRDRVLVSQGTREIGIRMALGATPRGILVLIVRHGMTRRLAGSGSASRGRSRCALHAQPALPDRRRGSRDVPAVAGLLTLVALFASFLPARRAARMDPTVSLRQS